MILRGCAAAQTLGTTVKSVGFDFRTPTDSNCMLDGCTAQNFQGAAGSAGIALSRDTTSVVQNCQVIQNGVGVLVQSPSSKNIIQKNTVVESILAGIQDTSTGNNAYIANVVRGPVAGGPYLGIYVGLPANTPIQTWAIGSAPSASVFPNIANLDITP